jgi:hypothetical protein
LSLANENPALDIEIARYLKTGDYDPYYRAWPEGGMLVRAQKIDAAHIFHNCKRETIGLPHTRTREWLLEIDFCKRETFAYACEAYSRILELGSCRAQFKPLLGEYAATSLTSDERVDDAEIKDILADAITARNCWMRILEHCSPMRRKTIREIPKDLM